MNQKALADCKAPLVMHCRWADMESVTSTVMNRQDILDIIQRTA